MTTIGSSIAGAAAPLSTTNTAPSSDSEKLSGVAKQFEAIFLRQMLAAARKTNLGGEDNVFSSQGMDTFRQMQDDRFADIASETGAFGLGKMIQAHLAKFAKAAAAATDTGAAATQGVTSNGI